MAKLKVGDEAPEFELPGSGGQAYRLADYRGRWLILAFYPGDFTPGCTRQFCSYRDNSERLAELDAVMLGISPQDIDSHERFIDKHSLTVPLLADPDREVIGAYGVKGPAGFVRRSIFIIDPDGIVRYRNVAVVGLGYEDVDDLGEALAEARR